MTKFYDGDGKMFEDVTGEGSYRCIEKECRRCSVDNTVYHPVYDTGRDTMKTCTANGYSVLCCWPSNGECRYSSSLGRAVCALK